MLGLICSHGVAPLPSLLTPSTTRFRFVSKLQLSPVATKAGHIFLSLSDGICLKAFCSRAESLPSLPASPEEEKLLTVSYLVTSCGILPDTALRAAKYVRFIHRRRALDVTRLLRSYRFSDAQINKMVSQRPALLAIKPEKSLKPKLDFLLSEGFSMKEVADIFVSNVDLSARNLETGLIATYRFLCATLGSRSDVIESLRYKNQCITVDDEPKFKMLRDYGVPESSILYLVKRFPQTLMRKFEYIESGIKALFEMGIDPQAKMFCQMLRVRTGLSNEAWLRRVQLFQEMGWSESEVIQLFKKTPMIFSLADESIRYKVDFFKKKLKWDQGFILRNPILLPYSIDVRILPRVSVLKLLMSKGLIKKKWTQSQFRRPDKWFIERYVKRYIDKVPDIAKVYGDTDAQLFTR